MIRRLLCRIVGHRPADYAGRSKGHHVAGSFCRRCRRVLSVRAGSRQERRRIQRQRVAA